MLSRIFELFLSKVVELIADNAHNNVKSIKEFELNLKVLQKKLKSLGAKASDVEEEIKNSELSGRKKRKREVEEWLEEVRSIEKQVVELGTQVESEGFIMRLMDGGLPAKLIEEVDTLVEQSRNFGELVLDICGSGGDKLLTNGMVGQAFHENLEMVLKLLESGEVSSIGVYGMGGVGKTTLAKHIHNRLLQHSQGRVIWVTVSQEFCVMTLQDKIAHFIGVDLVGVDNEDIRASRLHKTLYQMKNSVLILDDVWENIDLLKVGCPFSVEYCRLIITTRSLEVCRQICCQKVFQVKNLHDHEAWNLFKETLGNEKELDSSAEEIAKSVAKLCGGRPLGIVTVAGSMRGERDIHTWRNAYVELTERVSRNDVMGDGDVYKVLKYSFDRLNRNHRSQGGLVERKTRRAQVEQDHSTLNKLVSVCLRMRLIKKGEIGASAALAQPVFSFLMRLRIDRCDKMRIPLSGVPNIEGIHISECKEIEEIFEDEGTSSLTLPKLKYLMLHKLPRLRKVGILSGVPNLEWISVTKCGEIEDVFDDGGSRILTLPKLIQLYLYELPKLKSLCKGTAAIICNSIERISVTKCPRLMNKLPVDVDLAVPRHCKIKLNPELWDSLMSDDPNLSRFFSKG
ncbi:hypothetical protein SASPL_148260 [Salvia splendens]|uniref:AAA+ ATPase domain-containing protein n=1 Tax=Salvia splendens TaxID=180675 RepID=A0A8X8Z376_SALSN|nr:probable disease resistance protein At1g61310 [Salvia splendens]XP_042033065.1 probable disease resistance protein At1g61310 [Salvia splendens]XP_042033066.1 probable disease resistance protein At1g61310 [Salvia splendens]KAG6390522.1 hypothetical protein SASPL_148260 [Salvia splendens]